MELGACFLVLAVLVKQGQNLAKPSLIFISTGSEEKAKEIAQDDLDDGLSGGNFG